jgi:hypothetical protein
MQFLSAVEDSLGAVIRRPFFSKMALQINQREALGC